jgi:hypothetical protein
MQKNHLENNIVLELPYHKSTRDKTWVTIEQIETEHWYFMTKITEMLWWGDYSEKSKKFARSVLDFLVSHRFITWKQFDCVMASKEIVRYKKRSSTHANVSSGMSSNTNFLGNLIFGDKYLGEYEGHSSLSADDYYELEEHMSSDWGIL